MIFFAKELLAKIAFLNGYESYIMRSGLIALPGNWMIDDLMVQRFALDNGLIKRVDDLGVIKYEIDSRHLREFYLKYATSIDIAAENTVNELLFQQVNIS